MRMPLQFREDKATQVAARFLQLREGPMAYLKLVKLIYLADRKALVAWGRPITMDQFCSLRYGPLGSNVLDLINEEPNRLDPRYWHRYIGERNASYEVRLDKAPGFDQLSRSELEVIDEVFREHGKKGRWELCDWTHQLPEWRDPGSSSLPIYLRDILIPEGYTEDEVKDVVSELQYLSHLDYEIG